MYTGFHYATRSAVSFGIDDIVIPEQKTKLVAAAEREVKEIQDQYSSGLVTNGERYNKVVDIWSRANDQVAKAMMEKLGSEDRDRLARQEAEAEVLQLDLHDGRFRRARQRGPDPPAGRHARPDGQARRLDHRDADHGELPRGPERAAVLHLDARRPQGSGRHGAEDRELRLPDAASGRRGAGPGGHRVDCGTTNGLAMAPLVEGGDVVEAWASACSAACATDILDPSPGSKEVLVANTLLDEASWCACSSEGVDQISVRSPITCETRYGVCATATGAIWRAAG
jgi:DNA-directed RNA polymerase subunit beta'